jgi:hypothetical protein
MEKINEGDFVVISSLKDIRFWYLGTVGKIEGEGLSFKVYDAYNENMIGSTLLANINEVEFVENA